jgi:hypothetical protein
MLTSVCIRDQNGYKRFSARHCGGTPIPALTLNTMPAGHPSLPLETKRLRGRRPNTGSGGRPLPQAAKFTSPRDTIPDPPRGLSAGGAAPNGQTIHPCNRAPRLATALSYAPTDRPCLRRSRRRRAISSTALGCPGGASSAISLSTPRGCVVSRHSDRLSPVMSISREIRSHSRSSVRNRSLVCMDTSGMSSFIGPFLTARWITSWGDVCKSSPSKIVCWRGPTRWEILRTLPWICWVYEPPATLT